MYAQLNCVQNLFPIFYILKINIIMPFCNLFMGRPSYITALQTLVVYMPPTLV